MRNNKSESFPIIVMTRNEGEYLERCIESIIHTVSCEIRIYIVDNNSDDQYHMKILNDLEKKYSETIIIFRKNRNLWVLGVNSIIDTIKDSHCSDYFMLTDGDIDFNNCNVRSSCWLSYLIDKMDSNLIVGKLGLSLDWKYLTETPKLAEILKQERLLYAEGRKINDLYIAQVDTTATIFRWDWSMEKSSKLYPDHMRYLRPELYSCRTPHNITVEHLGWYRYKENTVSKKNINDKVCCFTLMGAALKPEIIRQASFGSRLFFILFSRMFSCFWIIRRYYILYRYIWKKGRKAFDGQV